MSKRILWTLTIALSVAMFGLIVVQVRWITNAFELNDQQFRQLVNTTLKDVSGQLDHYYTSSRMHTLIEKEDAHETEIEWNIAIKEKESPGSPVLIIDNERVLEFVPPVPSKEQAEYESIMLMGGDTVVVTAQIGAEDIDTIQILHIQDELKKEKIAKSLKEQEILVTKVMKQMLLEDIAFEDRIEQEHLEKALHKNMHNAGIGIDLEYAVIANNKKEIYSSEYFNFKTENYYYRTPLLENQLEEDEFYLYLYYPEQKAYIRSSMGYLGTSTVALTLLMIILFIFALYVIFRQKRLSDVKNDFVNNMTHELKTPISTISLASQMLNDGSIPDEKKNIKHISQIIQTESKRLGYQVERVLQMAVLDQGHLVLKKSDISMNDIVGTVMQNFKLQIENLNGKLQVVDESENDIVTGDRVHLMNVVTNLLDNAVKYSNESPEVHVHMESTDRSYKIRVKDSGIGISKENQRKVFDRFFRVSTGNVHDVKGFGLGLSYVKLIIEQHGGNVALQSEVNKGTEFTIELPLSHENNIES